MTPALCPPDGRGLAGLDDVRGFGGDDDACEIQAGNDSRFTHQESAS
jgi:hypothetical protein